LSWGAVWRDVSVFLFGASPLLELRGAIPYAILVQHMEPWRAFALAAAGNMLPAPALLLFYEKLAEAADRKRLFGGWLHWWFGRVERKSALVRGIGPVGLALFIGVPLPMTGLWTGAAIAALLRMSFWRALAACVAGVLIAGVAVTLLVIAGVSAFGIAK